MSEFVSIYVTTSTLEEAKDIAHALVQENLVACVNIIPGVLSIYRWQGKVEQANECAFIAKTTADKFDSVEKKVRELHSYGCPCIIAWPIVEGSETFLQWLNGWELQLLRSENQ